METDECIKTRRSVRFYKDEVPDNEILNKIISSAIYAPSGLNLQPWKIKILKDRDTIKKISDLCQKSRFAAQAPILLIVFLDRDVTYDFTKDVLSCGMLMQNIMLMANSEGLGSCLIGEINDKSDEVKKISGVNDGKLIFMGIITLCYQRGVTAVTSRKPIEKILI